MVTQLVSGNGELTLTPAEDLSVTANVLSSLVYPGKIRRSLSLYYFLGSFFINGHTCPLPQPRTNLPPPHRVHHFLLYSLHTAIMCGLLPCTKWYQRWGMASNGRMNKSTMLYLLNIMLYNNNITT